MRPVVMPIAIWAAVFTALSCPAWGQLSLRVGLDNGNAELVNIGHADLHFDGYSVFSPSSELTGDWSSLADQGLAGWDEADNVNASRLTEFNPGGSSAVTPGASISIGKVFQSTSDESTLEFQYTQPSGEVLEGLVQLVAGLSLSVDRGTGAVTFSNILSEALQFDAYTISSPGGSLSGEWNSLQDQALVGWDEADNSNANRLTEFYPTGATSVEAGQVYSLGNVYGAEPPAALGIPVPEDIVFQYTSPSGRLLTGEVDYRGPLNNVVLSIDPASGNATIQNQSRFFDVDIDGYTITSSSGVLTPDAWNSLADQGISSWDEADNSDANRLTELSPIGATSLDGGGAIFSLGAIIGPDAGVTSDDLEFHYLVAGGDPVQGVVTFAVADAGCVVPAGTLPGDFDGNGQVAFADFLTLSANFGNDVNRYELGDVDCNGRVEFADFLTLSANFGQTAGAQAVPEPAGFTTISMFCMVGAATIRRRRIVRK